MSIKNFIRIVVMIVLVTISYSCKKTNSTEPKPTPGLETGTVTDIDGNIYKTIKIGDQWWMAENLRVTKYRNGDSIPNVTGNADWTSLTNPAYCVYKNDFNTYGKTYGLLYNWYTVDSASNGNKSICPEGWYIPTNSEFLKLINYLGGLSAAGGKMKEAGTSHWNSPNSGASNTSGFSGLAAGFRGYTDGAFKYMGSFGHWWSRSQSSVTEAWNIGMFYLDAAVDNSPSVKKLGFSIRCVKD